MTFHISYNVSFSFIHVSLPDIFSKFIRILMILCVSFSLSTLIVIPLQTASDRKADVAFHRAFLRDPVNKCISIWKRTDFFQVRENSTLTVVYGATT